MREEVKANIRMNSTKYSIKGLAEKHRIPENEIEDFIQKENLPRRKVRTKPLVFEKTKN